MEQNAKTDIVGLLEDLKDFFRRQQSLYGDDIYMNYDAQTIALTSSEKKRAALAKLFYETRNCQKCELANSRNKFVFGAGDPESQIMLIGEAPGVNEDRQGKPFVGEAGQLLEKILNAIQLSRDKVFITNVVKCHPPGNRDPLPEECVACEPILKQQVDIIKPRFILILGRIAAHALLKTEQPLGELRGKVYDIFNAKAVVTYHPAALLRNPNLKRSTWEDVQLFQKLLK